MLEIVNVLVIMATQCVHVCHVSSHGPAIRTRSVVFISYLNVLAAVIQHLGFLTAEPAHCRNVISLQTLLEGITAKLIGALSESLRSDHIQKWWLLMSCHRPLLLVRL